MSKRINTDPYKDEIVSRYLAGETHFEIAEDMPFSAGTVIDRLHTWKTPLRKAAPRRANVIPYKSDIIKRYLSGESVHKIAEFVPFNHDTVHKRLREWNVPMRQPAHLPKYQINHTVFQEITEHSAYFAGLLGADGTISRQKGQWCISLTSKDIDVLEKFRLLVCPLEDKPFYDNRDGTFSFVVTSEQIGNDLISFGITPRKSLTIKLLDTRLLFNRHFWRGYLDGDGTISHTNKNKKLIGLYSGSRDIIEQFLDFLEYHGLYRNSIFMIRNKYYGSQYSGKSAQWILDLLYRDAKVFMDRKYALAIKKEVVP